MIAATSGPALAQGGSTAASIIGTVTDASGAVIPGATVEVKNNATATTFNATTNDQGGFTIPAVDPGSYTVTVTLMGFKTAVLNNVNVNAGTPAAVRVRLEVGGLEETVVVSGGRGLGGADNCDATLAPTPGECLQPGQRDDPYGRSSWEAGE